MFQFIRNNNFIKTYIFFIKLFFLFLILITVSMNKTILQKFLKAKYLKTGKTYSIESCTPQGGVISLLLANMALDGLGGLLAEKFPMKRHPQENQALKVNYIRYADDFVITGRSKEQLESLVLPIVKHFLQERALELSHAKTRIVHIDQGFDFLGQNIRKYNGNARLG
ncbi:reverse transcriptase domain-containing protein [Orientia tsutsugamushi]|uniref:reverse transcriptase domain-containing protein n=1 Tax=Orientia tsutsugamushi TaxID=784 RepID=UPI0011BA72E8